MESQQAELVQKIVAAAMGSMITLLLTKLREKTGRISYFWTSSRIALSANDATFGDVRATWQGNPVRNLDLFTFEIENSTSKDYENVGLKVYSSRETLILNEKTEVINTPYIVEWDEKYKSRQAVSPGAKPTKTQTEEHLHNREYNVPVFNRGQRIRFSFLCTRPDDDHPAELHLATPSRGIRLKLVANPSVTIRPILGAPISASLTRALFLCVVVATASATYSQNAWISSAACMLFGLTAQIFGALMYRAEQFIAKLISG